MSHDAEFVLTPAGLAKLEQRLEQLRGVQRREVAERIRDSRQFGDIAENAEYEDAKIEQALVESQIQELRRVLQSAQVLDREEIPTDHIGIGSVVDMVNVDTDEDWQLTIVSSVEADPDNDLISDASPIGEALMGKRVGELVRAVVPAGTLQYRIDSISK